MTEEEWLSSEDPFGLMFTAATSSTLRKASLFAAGCSRSAPARASFSKGPEREPWLAIERNADDELADPELLKSFTIREIGGTGEAWKSTPLALMFAAVSDSFVDRMLECSLLRDIFGNPFRPVAFSPEWRTTTAVALAQGMYESRDFGPMPLLADALQDSGCEVPEIIDHCRGPGPHVRGCWVVDGVLGKE